MANYPFELAKATGFADGQRLSGAHAQTIQDNAASAADGALWTDFAHVANYPYIDTMPGYGYSPVWSKISGDEYWLSFGVSGGNPVVMVGNSAGLWTPGGSIAAGSGLTPGEHKCADVATIAGSPNIVMGGTPGSASASKIRVGDVDGSSWAAASLTNNGTEGVTGLTWFPAASMFVCGLSNATDSNIETSPDGLIWTQRTGLPNSLARGKMATNGSILVILAGSSTNTCLTTTDGTSYASRTLPATKVWEDVAWSPDVERFFAFGSSSSTYAYSADGLTWTSASSSAVRKHVAFVGRSFVGSTASGADVVIGQASATAISAGSTQISPAEGVRSIATGNAQFGYRQVLVCDASGNHFMSLRGGF